LGIFFGIAFSILPIVIVIFVIAFVVKNKEQGGEEVIRHLYTYLVLFATLMMVIGGGISIFMATADLVSPTSYYESFENYKQMQVKEELAKGEKLSETELRSNYEQMLKDEEQRTKINAKNQLIKSTGFVIIPLPVFLYFNRLRKKIKEE
jgi:glucan phosphoethanolaminetransferase (alkaline phosphatase superfamily)